jgi:hypothetical protein
MTTLITDDQELVSAATRYGTPIKTYDDGSGPLYAYRDASGLVGLVRALDWDWAWEIVEDEILTPIPDDEIPEAYGFNTLEELQAAEEPDLVEGYSYQSNATGSGIVAHDLNGESLNELTPDLLATLEWRIEVKDLN